MEITVTLGRMLKGARHLLAGGWAHAREPAAWAGTELGNDRAFTDEDAEVFTVAGALHTISARLGGDGFEQLTRVHDALEFVETFACRGWCTWLKWSPPAADVAAQVDAMRAAARSAQDGPLSVWLEDPRRTTEQVLNVFARAIRRAEFLERSTR